MYLVDSNVISELRRRRTPAVTQWVDEQTEDSLFTSVIVLEELEIGARLIERRDPTQGALLRAWLETVVPDRFEGRILPVDLATAKTAASYHVPDPAPRHDALIGATAAVHDLTVVTRNVTDFERFGVPIFNPWDV